MKAKIIYIVAFLAAFSFTTAGIIYFNSQFKDIFKFDFTPVFHKPIPPAISDTAKLTYGQVVDLQNQLKNELLDSLRNIYKAPHTDTVYANQNADSVLFDSLKTLESVLKKTQKEKTKKTSESKQTTSKMDATAKNIASRTKNDSSYVQWTKQTAKLYESMDPVQAAKIIQSYSDNVARDIIYSMKQKKAAEILSALNPETANRITLAK